MSDDTELMARAARGDMDAFERLVLTHQQAALAVAYRFLGNSTMAEDAVQEAFCRILARAGSYRPSASFRTYLYNVIWHICIDTYRRKRPQELDRMPARADPAEQPPEAAMRRERAELVRAALQRLPARQRMALVLKHYEGLSYRQIARALDCSPAAVDSLLIRARRQLRRDLEGLA